MEATLPSWVKCTDPIPREILEEVRSTVLVWMKNVRKYYEENILNDGPFLAFWVDVNYPYGARVFEHQIEGLLRVKEKKGAWSTFIRQMLLSDVNIIHRRTHYEGEAEDFEVTDIVVGSREENNPGRGSSRRMLRLAVEFHDRLSSEIKDEICSKLASALRALKSRISRICGINELERRTQSLA